MVAVGEIGAANAASEQSIATEEHLLIGQMIGKAAWRMANAAANTVKITKGIVITKYGHAEGDIENTECYEASHPVLNEDAVKATEKVLEMVSDLTEKDTVLFLLSGGASALFESPLVSLAVLQDINRQLLASGASIEEINTIRKRLSKVKGGRFALLCKPARVFSIILSDIIDDRIDMIGSGPTVMDSSTARQALEIIRKYDITASRKVLALLNEENQAAPDNTAVHVSGSVRELCRAAEEKCRELGYETHVIDTHLNGDAAETGRMIGNKVQKLIREIKTPTALIYGGETVVKLTGKGLGGRNQELSLAGSPALSGLNACLFSVGSDGTDGPTDAAGGYTDGSTLDSLTSKGISVEETLKNNDSYHALKAIDALIITGPTGTNVNDLTVALLLPQ